MHGAYVVLKALSTMSRHGRAGGGGKKRKPAQAVTAARGSRDGKPSKKAKRANDTFYEAMDSDPDEEKHADRYDVSAAAMFADCCCAVELLQHELTPSLPWLRFMHTASRKLRV